MNDYFDSITLAAASASGVEAVTKRELTALGYDPKGADAGRIEFEGGALDVARANIFLRTADRVYVKVGVFPAHTFDELYDGVRALPWEDIIPADAAFRFSAKSSKSALTALSAVQSVAKKAAADRLMERCRVRVLPETGALYSFELALSEDVATLWLDTSGQGLHKRGYRTLVGAAPLRETLAAAMLLLSVWTPDRALIDPFCGSGTIPVEAALIAARIAPGLNREFAFEKFRSLGSLAAKARSEAQDLIKRETKPRISGFDIAPEAIKLANFHAANAGIADLIHLEVADMRKISSRFSCGVFVTNPPYGERLSGGRELEELYRDFGRLVRSFDGWSTYVITPYGRFENLFGSRAEKTRKLYNAELECRYYSFLGRKPKEKKGENSGV